MKHALDCYLLSGQNKCDSECSSYRNRLVLHKMKDLNCVVEELDPGYFVSREAGKGAVLSAQDAGLGHPYCPHDEELKVTYL